MWLKKKFFNQLIGFIKGLKYFYLKKILFYSYFSQWHPLKYWNWLSKKKFGEEQERLRIRGLKELENKDYWKKYCNLKEYYQWNVVKEYKTLFPFLAEAHSSFSSLKYCFMNFINFDSRNFLIAFGPCFFKFNHIDFIRRKQFLQGLFFKIHLFVYVKSCFILYYYFFIIMLIVSTRSRHLEGFPFASSDKELYHFRICYIYEKLPIERWFLNDYTYKFMIDDFFDYDSD